jgi:hypothetical protein
MDTTYRSLTTTATAISTVTPRGRELAPTAALV